MSTQSRTVTIIVVGILILAALGYFAWHERAVSQQSISNLGSSASSSLAALASTSVTIGSTSSTSGYTITPIAASGSSAPAAPDYKTPLTFSSTFSADDQASYESQFATIQTTLASNATDWGSWIDLGILRKETGDYAGAAADWKYITEIYPSDPTAFADLGDLYANDLNQPTQGITYYKDAIKLDPTQQASYYENLAQIYEQQGDSADARATLQQGISAQVVGYQNLQTELNSM